MHVTLVKDATITLIRHAQSEANAKGDVVGGVDADLTEVGVRQALLLEAYLKRKKMPSQCMLFSSDMPRAYKTAMFVRNALHEGCCDEVRIDSRLRELSRGEWDGMPRDVLTDAMRQEMAEFDMDHRPPNGESLNDKARSMRMWLLSLNPYVEEGITNFIAVTHGMAIASLLQRLFGIEPRYAWLMNPDNASMTRISCSKHGWRLDFYNATPHLENF